MDEEKKPNQQAKAALMDVIDALRPLVDRTEQARVLSAAAVFYGLTPPSH